MGMYDRDYYRDPPGGLSLSLPGSVVGRLILANVALWIIDWLFAGQQQQHNVTHWLTLRADDLFRPWMWWHFLSYGFAHDPASLAHLFWNMVGLWFFGQEIEQLYGRKEFLRLYLALLLVSSLIWAAINLLLGHTGASVIGASAAVVGVVLLFVLHYPRRTIYLMFVLPVPAWVLGVLLVGGDLWAAIQRASHPGLAASGDNVAYGIHLAGAAFALGYFYFRWNLGNLAPPLAGMFRRRPKLRVFGADDDSQAEPTDQHSNSQDLSSQVDEILAKIHREGENSLTRRERRILETASREYQRRRHIDRP